MEPDIFVKDVTIVVILFLLVLCVGKQAENEKELETRLQTIEKRLDSLTLDKEKTNVENP